jgi:sulfur-oxidizing protein SoxY
VRLARPGRRRWLGALLAAPFLALLPPPLLRRALAATDGPASGERPRSAFRARSLPAALAELGLTDAPVSADLRLSAPARAENGAVVPLKVEWAGPARAVNVLCAGNPVPLIARFEVSPRVEGRLSTRIKMGRTADITVITEAADTSRARADLPVEVTIGGCN